MTREELTLKAIATYNGNLHSGMTTALGAVVDMVLDQAADIAESFPAHEHGNLATAPGYAAEQAADEIAAAIRALKEKP